MDYGDTPLYRQYARDYFDVVIVDECHRGSARESSQWRAILEHFEPAVQIGMTATPIRRGETDTYSYFGDPIYEYSLAQGIDDGYLAPYRVRRVRLNVDMTGFRPTPGQRDLYGNEIPDKLYTQAQYERIMVILERTREAARYLTRFLRETDRMGKTIVFCENNDHAHRMREALNNANLDFVREHPNYVVRITDDDGDPGRALLSEFQDPGRDEPVIAVTSRLLSTGVDMPPVRNIVIFRRIGSVSEFKQIVGRGTRLCPDIDKASFDIIDFVDATILFNDPTFDGPPLLIREDTLDEQGDVVDSHKEQPGEVTATEPTPPEIPGPREDKPVDLNASTGGQSGTEVTDRDEQELIQARPPRYVVEGGSQIFVWGESFYQLDSDGRTLRLITYRQFVHDRVLELRLSAEALRTQWATARTRREMIDLLRSKEIEFEELTRQLQQPDVDPIDLLLNAAWGLPLVTRQERVARVRRKDRAFLDAFAPEAQEVLDALLTKFEEHDATVLAPATLRVPPLDRLGSVTDLAARFGGADGLHQALDDLGRRLFDVA